MKVALAFLLVGSSLCAHALSNQPAASSAQPPNPRAACGEESYSLKTQITDGSSTPPTPAPDKAMIYYIQDGGDFSGPISPSTHLAIDGTWVGGNKDNTYSTAEIAPGEHHVCIASNSFIFNATELAHFTAEPGKSYYFRSRIITSKDRATYMELTPIDSDEGWYLVNTYRRSTVRPKK